MSSKISCRGRSTTTSSVLPSKLLRQSTNNTSRYRYVYPIAYPSQPHPTPRLTFLTYSSSILCSYGLIQASQFAPHNHIREVSSLIINVPRHLSFVLTICFGIFSAFWHTDSKTHSPFPRSNNNSRLRSAKVTEMSSLVRKSRDVIAAEGCGSVKGGISGSNDCITTRDVDEDVANVLPSGDMAILLI